VTELYTLGGNQRDAIRAGRCYECPEAVHVAVAHVLPSSGQEVAKDQPCWSFGTYRYKGHSMWIHREIQNEEELEGLQAP